MKLVKGNALTNAEIKTADYKIKQSSVKGALKKHFRLGVIASSGQGKTNAVINMLKQGGYINDKELFQTIYLVSPSGCKDPDTGLRSERKWEMGPRKYGVSDVEYSQMNRAVLDGIVNRQKENLLAFKDYLAEKDLFKQIMLNPDDVDPWEMLRYQQRNPNMTKPESPFGSEYWPCALIIFDDITSSAQLKILSDFFSKSRHILASCICINQHYAQMSYGLRKQFSAIALFKNEDEKLLKTIYDQTVAGDMPFHKWDEMNRMLHERFDFIMINNAAPDDEKYRIGFSDYVPSSEWKRPSNGPQI